MLRLPQKMSPSLKTLITAVKLLLPVLHNQHSPMPLILILVIPTEGFFWQGELALERFFSRVQAQLW